MSPDLASIKGVKNMTQESPLSFGHTNVRVFYRIAQESYEEMNIHLNSNRRPKPNGEPGYIMTFDPEQKSFKNAFITIVFSGIFLESLLHLRIVKKYGLEVFKEYDRKPYEEKIKLLGCSDQSIIELCKKYRDARREIVHEKAYLNNDAFLRAAQEEAEIAIELVNKVVAYFKLQID
jgi:hypothetical protein